MLDIFVKITERFINIRFLLTGMSLSSGDLQPDSLLWFALMSKKGRSGLRKFDPDFISGGISSELPEVVSLHTWWEADLLLLAAREKTVIAETDPGLLQSS